MNLRLLLLLGLCATGWAAEKTSSPAVITSDELEIIDNGAQTVFRGHVILRNENYTLYADRMVRQGDEGPVNASGRVRGLWNSIGGERVEALGRQARYEPSTQVVELWQEPQLTRWETAADTQPVVIRAERFKAFQAENTLWAYRNVHITQGERFRVRCDEAKYARTEQKVYLWGKPRMFVDIDDSRGKAAFESDRGWVVLDEKKARLESRVRGHVIPAGS